MIEENVLNKLAHPDCSCCESNRENEASKTLQTKVYKQQQNTMEQFLLAVLSTQKKCISLTNVY